MAFPARRGQGQNFAIIVILSDATILKRDERRRLRALDQRASAAERACASELIVKLFKAVSGWESCRSILFFAPQSQEPDIWRLMGHALAAKKTVALPSYDSASGEYGAAVVRSLTSDLKKGAFGIREPSEDCKPIPLADIDMILAPGMGFDEGGRRLGRGKGFYDRILAQTTGIIVGLAFEWQMREKIPTEAHDLPMHRIVTPSRWLVCNEAPKAKRRPGAAVENHVEAP